MRNSEKLKEFKGLVLATKFMKQTISVKRKEIIHDILVTNSITVGNKFKFVGRWWYSIDSEDKITIDIENQSIECLCYSIDDDGEIEQMTRIVLFFSDLLIINSVSNCQHWDEKV